MNYTTLAEIQAIQLITPQVVHKVVSALNKSYNNDSISREKFVEQITAFDNLLEKGYQGKYLKMNTEPGKTTYVELTEEIQKAIDTSQLVKKQVKVTNKYGKVYMATRYVKANSDESPETSHKPKITGKDDEERILNIVTNPELKKSDKVRELIAMGVYDKKALMTLTGAAPAQAYNELKKEGLIGTPAPAATGGFGEAMPAHDGVESPILGGNPSEMSAKELKKFVARQRKSLREEKGIDYKAFWNAYESTLEGVILDGYPKSLIAYGTGGLGKTFTLDQVKERLQVREYDEEIDPSPDQYDSITIKGTTGLRDMWSIITKNRDKLIIFDDADSMWGTGKEEHQNILKGMLDTSGDGTVRYGNAGKDPMTGEQLPKQIKFTGQVIFISNLERKDFPQPLISSRCGAIDLSMTKDETMEKLNDIKYLIQLKGKGGKDIEIPTESRDAAFNFFKKYKSRLNIDTLNGRMFAQVAQIHSLFARRGNLEGFENEALIRTNLV